MASYTRDKGVVRRRSSKFDTSECIHHLYCSMHWIDTKNSTRVPYSLHLVLRFGRSVGSRLMAPRSQSRTTLHHATDSRPVSDLVSHPLAGYEAALACGRTRKESGTRPELLVYDVSWIAPVMRDACYTPIYI